MELGHENQSLIWHNKRFSGSGILTGMTIYAFLKFPNPFCISKKT